MSSVLTIFKEVLDRHRAVLPVQLFSTEFSCNEPVVSLLASTFQKDVSGQWIPTVVAGPKIAICDTAETACIISHEISHFVLNHLSVFEFRIIDFLEKRIQPQISKALIKLYCQILELRNRKKNEIAADLLTAESFDALPLATGLIKLEVINTLIDSRYHELQFSNQELNDFLDYAKRYQEIAEYLNENTDMLREILLEVQSKAVGRNHPTTKYRVERLGLTWNECEQKIVSRGFNLTDPRMLFDGLI